MPEDVGTIQEAIDASSDGDVICVGPGVYTEELDFDGHNTHILGVAGAAMTILDGGGASGTLVSVNNVSGSSSPRTRR